MIHATATQIQLTAAELGNFARAFVTDPDYFFHGAKRTPFARVGDETRMEYYFGGWTCEIRLGITSQFSPFRRDQYLWGLNGVDPRCWQALSVLRGQVAKPDRIVVVTGHAGDNNLAAVFVGPRFGKMGYFLQEGTHHVTDFDYYREHGFADVPTTIERTNRALPPVFKRVFQQAADIELESSIY